MSFKKDDFYTLVRQACDTVPEFKQHYLQFIEKATLTQNSKSLIENYSRCIAKVALEFNRVPLYISTDELNAYLYRICVHEKKSEGYFKQAVYGLRYWFKMFNMPERATCHLSKRNNLCHRCSPKKNVNNFSGLRGYSNTSSSSHLRTVPASA